jgi:hypothetical protein
MLVEGSIIKRGKKVMHESRTLKRQLPVDKKLGNSLLVHGTVSLSPYEIKHSLSLCASKSLRTSRNKT